MTTKKEIAIEFDIDEKILKGAKILYYEYTGDGYNGSVWVLLQRGKKLYEVNGGHCSCNGLEGQWEEELTSVEQIEHYLMKGTKFDFGYDSGAIKEVVRRLKNEK